MLLYFRLVTITTLKPEGIKRGRGLRKIVTGAVAFGRGILASMGTWKEGSGRSML